MAESRTPSGDEQFRIVDELLVEQSNTDTLERAQRTRYLVSVCWIHKWVHHVAVYDVYPGKLTMLTYNPDDPLDEFDELDPQHCMGGCYKNVWVHEPIWCKWVQWYGVDDSHELHRVKASNELADIVIGLKSPLGPFAGNTSKVFCTLVASEQCGYIELQLRRIIGITHDTETRMWHFEMLLDRSKELIHYVDDMVRILLYFKVRILLDHFFGPQFYFYSIIYVL